MSSSSLRLGVNIDHVATLASPRICGRIVATSVTPIWND
jgi:hypothetical protein